MNSKKDVYGLKILNKGPKDEKGSDGMEGSLKASTFTLSEDGNKKYIFLKI